MSSHSKHRMLDENIAQGGPPIHSEQGMSPCRASLGRRLKSVRLQLGISQRQFAMALDTAPNHIYQIERGRSMPGAKLLRGMRERFGIDINWLLSGDADYVATTLLERELEKLVRQFRHADRSARAMLLKTASFTASASL